jgi:DNA excision repair protein ERCC-3
MFETEGENKEAGILISTYNMMSYAGSRNAETQLALDKIHKCDWGLMIMDEVQVVPAKMFRKVLERCKSHCKLGLTATLVRED